MPPPPSSPVSLITGAGSGIGRALALLLASRGHRLILAARRQATLHETAALLPPGSHSLIVPTDVGSAPAVAALIDRAHAHFGAIHNLINNAGLAPLMPLESMTPDLIDEVFRVNALGPALAIRHCWPIFIRQRAGCIVNLSSLATADPFPGFFAYAAAKASVNLMARSAALEGAPHNIRAFAIAPGNVETPMFRAIVSTDQIPPSATLTPQSVATVILDCLEHRRDADNGATIFLPSPATH